MSELLLVIPPGWIQLDWQYITNNVPNMGYQNVMSGAVSDIQDSLIAAGIIPVDSSLQEFKLIDDTYFIIRLG